MRILANVVPPGPTRELDMSWLRFLSTPTFAKSEHCWPASGINAYCFLATSDILYLMYKLRQSSPNVFKNIRLTTDSPILETSRTVWNVSRLVGNIQNVLAAVSSIHGHILKVRHQFLKVNMDKFHRGVRYF